MQKEQHFDVYTTVVGDSWDKIAFKVLGDEKFTRELLKHNSSIAKLVILPPGLKILIPRATEVEVLPPWF